MAITEITRDWGNNPSIVRMVTNDTYQTITQTNYLGKQADTIYLLNSGLFEWDPTDQILVFYTDDSGMNIGSWNFFARDPITNTLIPQFPTKIKVVITPAMWNSMYDTPILVIPPPLNDGTILIDRVIFDYIFNTTAYTGGGPTQLQYGNDIQGGGSAATNSINGGPIEDILSSTTFSLAGLTYSSGMLVTWDLSKGRGIYLSNSEATYADGDSTIIAYIQYTNIITAPDL